MAFVVTSPYISEKAADCVDVCPANCIELGSDQYFINPDLCINCGACETACPVEAIYYEDELLDEDLNFFEKAKKYFSV